MNIVDQYREQLQENRPITYKDLELHPLTVRHFALYQSAKPAFELMQGTLPPALARLSWFNCLAELDRKAKEEGKNADFLGSVLRVLAAALRLEAVIDPRRPGEPYYPIRTALSKETGKPAAIVIGVRENRLIDARDMGQLRLLLAAQNGYTVPDENWSTELVKAQNYTQRLKAPEGVCFELEALVYSVSANTGVRAAEIWDWPLREFFGMQAAIDRKLDYQLYAAAELCGGVKFKHGNPCPTWKFDRKAELPGAFQDINELDAGAKGLLTDTTKKE